MHSWTQHQRELRISTRGQGMHDFTDDVHETVAASGVRTGICTVFVSHTSASLTIQEGADPDARRDLEDFLVRLAPEGDPRYRHTAEGPDDMPSHIRSALTSTSLAIPIANGRLALGIWQHVFLWEHRRHGSSRQVVVHVIGTT